MCHASLDIEKIFNYPVSFKKSEKVVYQTWLGKVNAGEINNLCTFLTTVTTFLTMIVLF